MPSETARRKRKVAHLVVVFCALLSVACSGRRDAGSNAAQGGGRLGLTIKGSDTMVILAQRWAEAFMKAHPGNSIQVSGGGSGTGIAALINGTTDIATASRPMKELEKRQLREKRRVVAVENKVALDAIAVYVHASNSIEALTIAQIKAIFRGRIVNWRQVGGSDMAIALYSRENNSGTYAYFKEHVLEDEDFAAETQTLPGTSAVIHAVAQDREAIGYGGIAYGRGVRRVPLVGDDGTPVAPTMESATSGRYPLARYLFIYTAGEPRGMTRDFIDFATSRAGQDLVRGVGYYPLVAALDRGAP